MDDYDYDRRGRSGGGGGGGGGGRRTGKYRDPNDDDDDDFDIRDKSGPTSQGTLQRLDSIQDPEKRYVLKDVIGSGVCGDVYEAVDQQAGNKKVAIKIQKLTPETQALIVEEYRVLRDFAGHSNLPDFYGIYRRRSGKKTEYDQIWFVMELCEGGSVMDLVRGLIASNKKMREEHIAYILKEVIKALIHLHENNIIHRDVRGSNILLTKEGEIRLIDFGLSKMIKGELGKRNTCIGSPNWMAPEMVTSKTAGSDSGYGSRADVWAVGITAIELADGRPPFQDMHPTRALFQIVRNPPPTLYRQSNWTQNFNDFISECLEKNPDNRPFMAEIIEHPFLSELPENDYLLAQEIKALAMDALEKGKEGRQPEAIVRKNLLKTHQTKPPEAMFTEDLAALEVLTEDAILDELHERLQQGHFHTFVGDVLLILNPNERHDIYGPQDHTKYQCKSRSDNAPHVYSVADSAYQDVLHNEEPQHILFSGESNSGKTTNMLHAIEHLMFLGKSLQDTGSRLLRALKVIHVFSNAATPLNPNSTRCVLQIQTTFGSSGKASGAIFWLYQLEKWRVSTRDRNQSNFHIFYYFYDGLDAAGKLRNYNLPSGRRMRYLRISERGNERKRSFKVRNDPDGNVTRFGVMKENLKIMEMEEYCDTLWKILAAILLLGEIRFVEGSNGVAEMDSNETANRVAELLDLDPKKFSWALMNYCLIRKGAAVRKKHTCEEAREARDVLANTIYQRLVDWLINMINLKFTVTRTLFGDKYSISVLDLFGFECFAVNRIEQLFVNTTNEQMQCHYNQRIFAWEMQEQEEEDITIQKLHFYDNKEAIDQLMGKDTGLFHIIDDASRQLQDVQYIFEKIRRIQGTHIKQISSHEFTVAHYTGKLVYDASEIAEKNRDFVPPEMIETLRLSSFETVKQMFTNKLTKSGSLTIVVDTPQKEEKKTKKSKWETIMQETTKLRKYNTASKGQYSQTRKMRTCAATFRSSSLEILKSLSVGGGSGGVHFIRCIRADLEGTPQGFYRDVVRQQIRALAVLDTAKARQRGYPYRITFQEFIRRYKFLAFDFDENVEMTKDNCRLLLVRLKMEGWIIGKTKVFLKYYNEEYLSRLYETQVKKIVKVQCMMRAFLARKNIATKVVNLKKQTVKKASIKKKEPSIELSQEDAALILQKAYRGHVVRKETAPLMKGEEMDQETKDFIKFYSSKWRSKTIFQVLLHYRAARFQDLVHFSQQVHLYNQAIAVTLEATNERIPLDKIDPNIKASSYIGQTKPPQVNKLPFDIYREMPYFDTSYMSNTGKKKKKTGSMSSSASDDEHEPWDAPLRRQTVACSNIVNSRTRDVEVQTTNSPHRVVQQRPSGSGGQSLINTPFSRDPNIPVRCPPEDSTTRPKISNTGLQQAAAIDRSPIGSSNAHNPRSNNYENTGSVRSKKHAPPPPIPYGRVSPAPIRNYDVHNSESRSRNNLDTGNDWEFDDKINRNVNALPGNRPNPIQELQMLGRRNNNDDGSRGGDDQPPFNFQAMLRKTPHQRASMKRTAVYDSYVPSPSPYGRPISHEDQYESNVVYRSSGSRRDSSEWSPNEMIRMSEKYGREGAWSAGGDRSNNTGDVSESITTELAPGIVVEGYVSEL
ncbi:PREDICTED: neither inactivation nor afterpotential protein C isoform X1 [Polistes dominula]|uniref:non-specific serine/threonine protein kinase n=1 Tax=Polistes dominula TaxID=743375 RepID=A0ABM1IDV6_POLDO|nr:PREDICTED: neither inactivation nor afterpotential protein C isoform X1 [Polistes dominula]XP_015178393.1 PREDICTED: neither inactivation nor afterpotential protein C isoform X1 [Polistes dominula]